MNPGKNRHNAGVGLLWCSFDLQVMSTISESSYFGWQILHMQVSASFDVEGDK